MLYCCGSTSSSSMTVKHCCCFCFVVHLLNKTSSTRPYSSLVGGYLLSLGLQSSILEETCMNRKCSPTSLFHSPSFFTFLKFTDRLKIPQLYFFLKERLLCMESKKKNNNKINEILYCYCPKQTKNYLIISFECYTWKEWHREREGRIDEIKTLHAQTYYSLKLIDKNHFK